LNSGQLISAAGRPLVRYVMTKDLPRTQFRGLRTMGRLFVEMAAVVVKLQHHEEENYRAPVGERTGVVPGGHATQRPQHRCVTALLMVN
jgi:hypothetical protein